MRKLLIIFFVVIFLSSYIFLTMGDEIMENNINLRLESDKARYSIGETIKFTYSFVNNSSSFVCILPWGGHYFTNWIVAYDKNEERLQDLPLVILELKFSPSKEDFVFIPPRGTHAINIEGKIVKTELSKYGAKGQKKHKGLFINFGNSAINLKRAGEFTIKAIYDGMDTWEEQGSKLFNGENVWAGKLESNKLKIAVE